MKINQFNYNAYRLRGIVFKSLRRSTESTRDFEQAAKLRSDTKIVGSIYKVDVSGGKTIIPPLYRDGSGLERLRQGRSEGLVGRV